MKKYQFIFIVIICFAIIYDFFAKKNIYNDIVQKIEEQEQERDVYYAIFYNYFKQNHQYPKNILLDLINAEPSKDLRTEFKILFEDPFSKGEMLQYIPIKNESGLIMGYCLLSRGPDKKINTKITQAILLSNIDKIKLYKTYNYFDFYFGKKDLLISAGYNK